MFSSSSRFSNMKFQDDEFEFREIFDEDENGLYITMSQVNFFVNDVPAYIEEPLDSPEFLAYYDKCVFYNLCYDMMEKDPSSGIMYWDDVKETFMVAFPPNGLIAKRLDELGLMYE